MTDRDAEKSVEIVKSVLSDLYDFDFKVSVVDDIDDDFAEEHNYVRLLVVFDSTLEAIKESWRIGFHSKIRKLMAEANISEFPALSFVTKDGWENGQIRRGE